MRKWIIVLCLPMICLAGCQLPGTEAPDASGQSVISEADVPEKSLPYYTEYEVPVTFEYTEEMLYEMNEDNEDFSIVHDNEQHTLVDGNINRSPVSSEKAVTEQLMMVRSVLGLVNPKQQLTEVPSKRSDDRYYYSQYYGGIRFYSSGVNVLVDTENQMICMVEADIISEKTLQSIHLDGLLDAGAIRRKNPSVQTIEKVIWDTQEYKQSPVVAYIAETKDDMVFVYSAADGSILSEWSTIMT